MRGSALSCDNGKMRRIIVSALISGFAGIAALLFGAMSKAGCWSRTQHDFWQHLPSQQADVYFQISDLMIKGQMLLIKKDLVEFGFDYFMGAVTFGLFLLLIFEVGEKRFNQCGSINSKPSCDIPTQGPFSIQFPFTVVLPALFPTLFLLVVVFPMFSGGSMDAMSIAILLPTSVLLTLIVAAAQKKRLFPWQQRIDRKSPVSGELSREAWAVIILAGILPVIGVLTAVVFFLADGCMDATTIAILVPSLVLNAMVLAAAYKKRLFPWQEKVVLEEGIIPSTAEGMAFTKFKVQATVQIVIYLRAPAFACGVVALCSHYITWSTEMLWVRPNSIAPSFENYVRAGVSDMSNMLVAVFITTIFVYVSEVLLYRKKRGGELVRVVAFSAGPIFCAFLMSWFLFWFLPAALPVVLNHPLPIYSERSMTRELYRICSSLSTISALMTGIVVALSGNKKVAAFISSVSRFPWCCTEPRNLGALEK